jgi:chitin biosynthesis protein CHS5
MVPISGFYLGTTQSSPMNSAPFTRPQSMSQASLPQSAQAAKAANRASMPAPSRTPTSPGPIPPASSESSKAVHRTFEPTLEESADGDESDDIGSQRSIKAKGPPRARHGTMDREFKFPPAPPESDGVPRSRQAIGAEPGDTQLSPDDVEEAGLSAPSSSRVEVPPPPPIEKERPPTSHDDGDEDVGETEEISLN